MAPTLITYNQGVHLILQKNCIKASSGEVRPNFSCYLRFYNKKTIYNIERKLIFQKTSSKITSSNYQCAITLSNVQSPWQVTNESFNNNICSSPAIIGSRFGEPVTGLAGFPPNLYPNNSFNECIKFWYAKEDFKPFASDDLGQSAVDSINRLFIDKPYPAQEGLTQKILAAKNYWESIKK